MYEFPVLADCFELNGTMGQTSVDRKRIEQLLFICVLGGLPTFRGVILQKDDNSYQRKPSKVALFFWLFVAIITLCSWAVMLSPSPTINPVPDWIDAVTDKVAWSVGAITFVLICFTKPGHQFLNEASKGKLAKQALVLFGMPVFAAFFSLLTMHAAISGVGGMFVSFVGESEVVTGEIVSRSYTDSRGCRYRTDIRWFPQLGLERHCYSEELWAQIKVGQTVSQKRWRLGNFYAQAHFAWPNIELPAAARQAEILNAWKGFTFLGAILFIPAIGCLASWFFRSKKTTAGL